MASSYTTNASLSLPPAYDEIDQIGAPENTDPNRRKWCKALADLQFNQEEINEYATLFTKNEVVTSMIPELTDEILKSIGIEKAGHRIQILRLKKKISSSPTPPHRTSATVITPRCVWHPNIAANEKCRKCKRLVCLNCRRESHSNGAVRYYCPQCYNECIIL